MDLNAIYAALEGVYGAWVNPNTFAIGEQYEVFLGMRIFELAKQIRTVRHYVWSNLDYVTKVASRASSVAYHHPD